MFNRASYGNSVGDGFGVLEVTGGVPVEDGQPPLFVPLKRTELTGEIAGLLASLCLTHTYSFSRQQCDRTLEAVYRCPSDNLPQRPNASGTGAYRYSYSWNDFVALPDTYSSFKGQRFGFLWNGKITSVRRPAEIILLICEDEKTLDDGCYRPDPTKWGNGSVNVVASRHMSQIKKASGNVWHGDNGLTDNARGNVSFFDGHAEFFDRKDATRQRYTGSPNADPNPY